jgi:hypothetical protein
MEKACGEQKGQVQLITRFNFNFFVRSLYGLPWISHIFHILGIRIVLVVAPTTEKHAAIPLS